MLSVRAAVGALGCLAILATAEHAQADGARCTAAAEGGQRARAAGQLRSAHRQFLECSTEECPAIVRRDCAQWASSVSDTIPSIVVDARDAAGKDVGDVSVSVDGAIVVSSLDGKAIPLDPGPHTLVFARAGSSPVTEKVILKEGARGRTFVVRFGGAAATSPSSPASDDTTTAVSGAPRGHTWPPWVLVGVGAVSIGAGVVVILTRPQTGCDLASQICLQKAGESEVAFKTRQDDAVQEQRAPLIGGILIGGGALTLAGGLLWHFLEPTGPRKLSTSLVPWTTASGGGLAAVGTF